MGSDIEGVVEFRKPGQRRWEVAYDLRIGSCLLPPSEDRLARRIWPGRNYRLYGVLMGARDYSLVAPIQELRGIPEDATPRVRKQSRRGPTHSQTWYLLSELLAFDWNRPCEDRRGPNTFPLPAGRGQKTTYGELVGENVLEDLQFLVSWAVERGVNL